MSIDEKITAVVCALRNAPFSELPHEVFDEWNVIPYGIPAECRRHLLVIIDGSCDIAHVLSSAITHLSVTCSQITKTLLIYVSVDVRRWRAAWFKVENAFARLEARGVDLHVRFNTTVR